MRRTCYFALPRIVALVPEVAPLFGERIAVRLLGVDAPETRGAKCERERHLGAKAKEFTERMLIAAGDVSLDEARPDKYFRVLGNLKADGVEVAEALKRAGLAREYDGGGRDPQHWCRR